MPTLHSYYYWIDGRRWWALGRFESDYLALLELIHTEPMFQFCRVGTWFPGCLAPHDMADPSSWVRNGFDFAPLVDGSIVCFFIRSPSDFTLENDHD